MRLRRYEAWILIEDDIPRLAENGPAEVCKGKFFTRKGAEARINYILGDIGLNLGLLMAQVRAGVEITVRGEVREVSE